MHDWRVILPGWILAAALISCNWVSGLQPETPGPPTPEPSEPTAAPDAIRVLILLGQSNMVGQARGNEFPQEMSEPSENRLILTDDGWIPLVPGPRNGPEISLVHELANAWPDETIGIIKVAVGGTGIRAFIPDWTPEGADLTGDAQKGPLFEEIQSQIWHAVAIGQVQFVGVVWKQGGADSWRAETADGYLDHLEEIINAIRLETGVAHLPLLVSTYLDADELLEAKDLLQEQAPRRLALFDVLMAHNLASEQIPFTLTVTTGWLPTMEDGIHFNTEGQILQGRYLAEAVLAYDGDLGP